MNDSTFKVCDLCGNTAGPGRNIKHNVDCPNHPDAIDDTPQPEPVASNVASFALAKADKGSKPNEHPALAALDLARDWVREANLTPTHCIVFLARANEDGSDGIKFFQSGDYRSHAQTGMVIEGLDMMRSTGTYYQGD